MRARRQASFDSALPDWPSLKLDSWPIPISINRNRSFVESSVNYTPDRHSISVGWRGHWNQSIHDLPATEVSPDGKSILRRMPVDGIDGAFQNFLAAQDFCGLRIDDEYLSVFTTNDHVSTVTIPLEAQRHGLEPGKTNHSSNRWLPKSNGLILARAGDHSGTRIINNR